MINYQWQTKFLNEPNNYAMLCAEVGCGKSHVAGEWVKQNGRDVAPVVFCPKQIVGDWQKRAVGAQVFTPQTILKQPLPNNPTAIIVDEADAFASPLFVPTKRSKCAERLYNYIRQNPQSHILLLTATPVRSTPWNLHTLLVYLGRYIDFKEWRDKYFYLDQPRYMTRPGYFPRPGWQKMMQEVIDKNATVALMKDMVNELPPETTEIIKLKAPVYEKNEEWEAAKQFVEDHLLEQAGKAKEIKRLARGYRKLVVVAHYREQIDALYKELSSERETFVLDGRTTNVADVISSADASDECYFIIQSSIGAGFEIPSFSCMVFASQSYSARNYTQMRGRIRRINALKPVIYYHLIGGRCDKMIKDSIDAGKDFIPSFYRSSQQ
jgi:superfamily II DNA or RNA helicase